MVGGDVNKEAGDLLEIYHFLSPYLRWRKPIYEVPQHQTGYFFAFEDIGPGIVFYDDPVGDEGYSCARIVTRCEFFGRPHFPFAYILPDVYDYASGAIYSGDDEQIAEGHHGWFSMVNDWGSFYFDEFQWGGMMRYLDHWLPDNSRLEELGLI